MTVIVGVDSGDYHTHIYWVDEERVEPVSHEPNALHEWFQKHKNRPLIFALETLDNAFIRGALAQGFSVFVTPPFQSKNMRNVSSTSGEEKRRL